MSAKIKCPMCKTVLKEEGDNSKKAKGEYRVYDSVNKNHRLIECLVCRLVKSPHYFIGE